MTFAKLDRLPLPSVASMLATARGFLNTSDKDGSLEAWEPAPVVEPVVENRERFERLLEHELDRQLLTEVEREDTDMLNRVRDALYADD